MSEATRLAAGAYKPLPDQSPQGASSDPDRMSAVGEFVVGGPESFAKFAQTPSTQNGVVPDQTAKHVQESDPRPVDPVNLADAPDVAQVEVVYPESAPYGAGSLTAPVDGWHPGASDD